MLVKLNTNKVARWMFSLLLLSGVAHGANAPGWESETLSLGMGREVSLPVRIAPVLVEAPPRYVDLFPSSVDASRVHDNSFLLTGLPVDLYEFPVLKFSAVDQKEGRYGLELALNTHGKGTVDTLVRFGDPALFPDMAKERIDFSSAEVVLKDLGYKVKRTLGYGGDAKWRYTAVNSKVSSITNGVVSASFGSGGDFVLQRAFTSLELSKTPWLRYEYELPEGLPWVVQVNAKIDRGGLNPKLTPLFSAPLNGGGKQKLLVNLLDLLQKTNLDAKDGRLEELIIHFKLDETAEAASLNVSINLGRLELYHAQMLPKPNGTEVLLVSSDEMDTNINLLKALDKRLSSKNNLTVLGGRLVSAQLDIVSKAEDLPRISLLTEYREKIPELFIGDRVFLDELSGDELSAVLDQRMFMEKQVLWESGQSDVVFLKQAGANLGHGRVTLPLVSYPLDARIEGDTYIRADYSFAGGTQFPLYLTVSGIDQRGSQVVIDHLLLKNRPLKIKDVQIKKITLSFRHEVGAASPPDSFIIKKIQLFSLEKTAVYHPKPALAHIALDGNAVPEGNIVWRASPGRFVINLRDGEDFQTVQTFPLEAKIEGYAAVRFDFVPAPDRNLAYLLRVRGRDGGGYFERLFPMNQRGEVRLSNMVLHGLDIAVVGDARPSSATVLLNQLDVQYLSKVSREHGEPQKPAASASDGMIYLAPHFSLMDPMAVMGRPTLATELVQLNLAKMNKLDATLSYAQILEGGKNLVLPKTYLGQGGHALNFVADEGVRVTVDPSFLKSNHDRQTAATIKADVGKAAPSKLLKLGMLILAVGLMLLGVKFMPRWVPLVDRALSWELGFWGVQFLLFSAALYLMFFGANKNALSWGGLILAFAYGIAVRYKIRPFLAKKWGFFNERLSAPYFLLFLALLLSCAVMLMLKLNTAAENTATTGYFLMLSGVVIDFIGFAKAARLSHPEVVPSKSDYL